MAEIRITAMSHGPGLGGPDLPTRHHAWIKKEKVFDEADPIPVLRLNIGNDSIRVWPADPEYIADLGRKLIACAESLTPPRDHGR